MAEVEATTNNVAPAAPQQTFQERKAQQLKEERNVRGEVEPVAPQPVEDREATPSPELESAQIDGNPDLPSDEDPLDDEWQDSDPDGIPDTDPEAAEQEGTTDWEKRYTDTQAELTRVNQHRQELDTDHADMMAGTLQLRHTLEDKLSEVENSSGYILNGLSGQIANMEQAFSSGQIDPEQMANARNHYQQLVNNRNQMQQHLAGATKQRDDATAMRKQREAEITRIRLQRTIPNWSREKYAEMREFATQRGYTQEEFNDVTDHRLFELLHDSMQLRSASDTVSNVQRKRKADAPRGRGGRAPRDKQGRYEKSRKEFHDNPNQKGRFAAMKAQELAKERGR
jgi:hypothetical protein